MSENQDKIAVESVAESVLEAEDVTSVNQPKGKHKITKKKVNRLVFYCVLMAFPLIQLGIFYFGINFKSILLSFQSFDMETGKYVWTGFDNFKTLFNNFTELPYFGTMVKNTLLGFFIPELVTFVPSIITSYYVYKRFRFSKFFKVVMFLPSILSVLALSLVQFYLLELGIPNVISAITGKPIEGLITNPNTAITTLICVSIWFGFCQGIMIYPATMSSIPDSIIEAAKIDGCSVMREFIYIAVPSIWPTIVVKFIADLCGIAAIDLAVFNMLGEYAPSNYYTIGYYLYTEALHSNSVTRPMLSAFGLFLTVILVPLVLLIRKALNKFGPSTE